MPVRRLAIAGLFLSLLLPAGTAIACPPEARPMPPLALGLRSPAKEAGRALSILAIGSSTTTGVGASGPAMTFPAQLTRKLTEAWGAGSVEVVNAGVSGERAPATLRRLQAFMAHKPPPDLVIWQVGTNDVTFGSTPARLATAVQQGLDAIAAAGAQAIVVDQQYFPAILNRQRYEAFVAAVREAAASRDTPLLDRYALMKAWAARDPAGFQGLLSWDRFHMNDAGYACLADLLATAILAAADPAAAPIVGARTKPAGR